MKGAFDGSAIFGMAFFHYDLMLTCPKIMYNKIIIMKEFRRK